MPRACSSRAGKKTNAKDPFLKDAYIRGLERLGKPGIDALLALAASGDKGLSQAVDAFVTLRSREGAAAVPQLLANPQASPAQREALVASYTNYQFDPPLSLDPLAELPGVASGRVAGRGRGRGGSVRRQPDRPRFAQGQPDRAGLAVPPGCRGANRGDSRRRGGPA